MNNIQVIDNPVGTRSIPHDVGKDGLQLVQSIQCRHSAFARVGGIVHGAENRMDEVHLAILAKIGDGRVNDNAIGVGHVIDLIMDITVSIEVAALGSSDKERIIHAVRIVGNLREDRIDTDGRFLNGNVDLSVPNVVADLTVIGTGQDIFNCNLFGDLVPGTQREVEGVETGFGHIRTELDGVSTKIFQHQRIQGILGTHNLLAEGGRNGVHGIHDIGLGSHGGTAKHIHHKVGRDPNLGEGVNHHRRAVAVLLVVNSQIQRGVIICIGLRIDVDVEHEGVIGRIVVGVIFNDANCRIVQDGGGADRDSRIVLHHEVAGGVCQADAGPHAIDILQKQTGEHVVAGGILLPSHRHGDRNDVTRHRIIDPTKHQAVNTGEQIGEVASRFSDVDRMVPEGEAQGIDAVGQFRSCEHLFIVLVHLEEQAGQRIREAVRVADEVKGVNLIGFVFLTAFDVEAGMDDGVLVGGNHINRRIFGPVLNREAEHSGDSGNLHALGFRQSTGTVREQVRRKACGVSPFPGHELKCVVAHRMHIRHEIKGVLQQVSQTERGEHLNLRSVAGDAARTVGKGQGLVLPFQFQMTEI